jgi:hypothetical protein
MAEVHIFPLYYLRRNRGVEIILFFASSQICDIVSILFYRDIYFPLYYLIRNRGVKIIHFFAQFCPLQEISFAIAASLGGVMTTGVLCHRA